MQRWDTDEQTRPEINLPMQAAIERERELVELRKHPERSKRKTIPFAYDLENLR